MAKLLTPYNPWADPPPRPPGICLPAKPPANSQPPVPVQLPPQSRVANRQSTIENKETQPAVLAKPSKSTGPITIEGKAISSRNSLKHGLLAKSVVVDSPTGAENRAEFDALLADLCAELEPHGLIEQTLVERIATCYWRLNRVQRYETGAVRESLEVPDEELEDSENLTDQLAEAELTLAAMDRLEQLLALPPDGLTAALTNEIRDLSEKLPTDTLTKAVREIYGVSNDADPADLRGRLPYMRVEHLQTLAKFRHQVKQYESQAQLRDSRRNLVSSLPDGNSLLKVIRYETMLDRQIHRALHELRRLRNARL